MHLRGFSSFGCAGPGLWQGRGIGGGLLIGVLLGAAVLLPDASRAQIETLRKPSPQAASLVRAGDVSVDYYTGNPKFSRTLHVVKTANVRLPITLSHDGRAVKPNEESGWVGEGWSLNAGGAISRSVKGKPDESTEGYGRIAGIIFDDYMSVKSDGASSYAVRNSNSYSVKSGSPVSDRMHRNLEREDEFVYDLQPDIYSYRIINKSGSIMIDPEFDPYDGNSADSEPRYRFAEANGMRIDEMNSHGAIIRSDRGHKYTFGSPNGDFGDGATEITSWRPGLGGVRTSWYLRNVSSYGEREIQLRYEGTYIDEQRPYSAVRYVSEGCKELETGDKVKKIKVKHVVRMLRVISTRKEIIVFEKSKREDRVSPGNGDKQAFKLDRIKIYNNNSGVASDTSSKGVLKKSINFHYSYFTTENEDGFMDEPMDAYVSGKRLRLDSVNIEGGGSNNDKYSYNFKYYSEDEELEGRYSRDVDHWGYPNSANNPTGTSYGDILPHTQFRDMEIGSADKSPSGQISTIRPGALKKILHPTGGSTTFKYELDKYNGYDAGGGMRLARIIDSTGSTEAKIRRFDYNSSGSIAWKPKYKFSYKDFSDVDTYRENECKYVNGVKSYSTTPFGSASSKVRYKKVDVLYGPEDESGNPKGGKIVYKFTMPGRYGDSEKYGRRFKGGAFAGLPPKNLWQAGRKKNILKTDANGDEVVSTSKVYSRHANRYEELDANEESRFRRVIGAKNMIIPGKDGSSANEPDGKPGLVAFISWYSTNRGFMHPDTITVNYYDSDGKPGGWRKIIPDYYGETHVQPTIRTVKTSNGLRRTTKYKYAHEEYPRMADENMMTQKYRTTVFEDADNNGQVGSGETVWKRSWTDWTENIHGHWVPESEWVWTEESDQ